MKKIAMIAMIAMLFGFIGAVHADGSCHHPLGCGYMKPDVEEESGWIEKKPTDDPIVTAQPTGNGGFISPPQAEPTTMLAEGGCYVNDQGEEVCYGENGEILGAVDEPTMMAGSQLNQCKWQCDEYQDGSQACYETCEEFHGGQASANPTTMIAYDDSQQSDPWSGEGGAMLKPEPEYDIKLNNDPLCDTDPYSCFHLADNDATVVRPDESQQAFLVLCSSLAQRAQWGRIAETNQTIQEKGAPCEPLFLGYLSAMFDIIPFQSRIHRMKENIHRSDFDDRVMNR